MAKKLKNLTSRLAVPIVAGALAVGCGGGSGSSGKSPNIGDGSGVGSGNSVLVLNDAKGVISSYLVNPQQNVQVSFSDGMNLARDYDGLVHVTGQDNIGRTHCLMYNSSVPTPEFLISKDCDNVAVVPEGTDNEIGQYVMNEISKSIYPRLSERRDFGEGYRVNGEVLTRGAENVSCYNVDNLQLVPFTYMGESDGQQVWEADLTSVSAPGHNIYSCEATNAKGTSEFMNAGQANLKSTAGITAETTLTGSNASYVEGNQVPVNYGVSCSLPAGVDPQSFGLEAKLLADGNVVASSPTGNLNTTYSRPTIGTTTLRGACTVSFEGNPISTTQSPNTFNYTVTAPPSNGGGGGHGDFD